MSKIAEVGDFAVARLVQRTFLCTREYGAADAFRRAAWKVCRARFERLQEAAGQSKVPLPSFDSSIRNLSCIPPG